MPRSAAPLHERVQPIAGADEHEVRVALPVFQPEALAGGVQQRLRFARLPQVVLHVGEDRRAPPGPPPPRRCSRCRPGSPRASGLSTSGAPTRQPMRRPARPKAFENVRPTITLGNAGSSGMNVAPANSAYASSTNTTASRGTRRAICRIASSGIDTPVGLFGFVRNTTRVRGVIAASTSSSGEAEVGPGHHLHEAAADDIGVDTKDFERRLGDDRFRNRPAHRRPQVCDGEPHDPFVEAVGQREAVGVDAEVLGARLRSRPRTADRTRFGRRAAWPARRAPAASSRRCSRSDGAAARRRAPAACRKRS